MALLDFLFPKRCVNCRKFGSYICSHCFSYISFLEFSSCVVCQRPAIGGRTHVLCKTRYTIDGVFPSLVYQGVVKKLIYNFKYPPYLKDLQPVLLDFFYEGLIQKEAFCALQSTKSLLVPVPLHSSRMKWRGYNQSALLAQGMGKRLSMDVSDCLKRVKKTQTQVGLSQAKRLDNMKDAFMLKKSFPPQYSQIFLVDDVVTSGATLREAAKVFKKAGVENVWGITLAHGQ